MLTENQKNFRKQMKQIEKDLKNKKQDSFYSYIEDDYINSYYSKKKKRIVTVSFSTILIMTMIGLFIYRQIQPLINKIDEPIVNMSGSSQTGQNNIVSYLNSIHQKDMIYLEIVNYSNNEGNNLILKKSNLEWFNNYTKKLTQLIIETSNLNAYFGRIRTLIPETSGQRFGIIRTA